MRTNSPPFGVASSADRGTLLVEDDPADVELFRLALGRSDVAVALRVAESGERPLENLTAADAEDGTVVDLFVLDRKLLGRSGLEERTREVPVETTPTRIVSTADDRREVGEAYGLGATAYPGRRPNFEDNVSPVDALAGCWRSFAELPDRRLVEDGRERNDRESDLGTVDLGRVVPGRDVHDVTRLLAVAAHQGRRVVRRVVLDPLVEAALRAVEFDDLRHWAVPGSNT